MALSGFPRPLTKTPRKPEHPLPEEGCRAAVSVPPNSPSKTLPLSSSRRRRRLHIYRHGGRRRPPPLATIARAAALPTARLLLRGRMASSATAALLVLPVPSSSSSDESDDAKPLSPPPRPRPVGEASLPSPQQRQLRRWRILERDCNVQMKALARAGDVEQVVELFAELSRSASSAGTAPNVLCYNTLLNALAEAGRAMEVRCALGKMLTAGVAPNASTFNVLVKLYAWRTAQFDLAHELFCQMRKLGVEADVGAWSTLITGLCRAGEISEALGVLDVMVEECPPMVHTYTPIVQGYCREGRIEEAKKLMALMELLGCPPNVVTYNVLIRALCDDARFDEVEQLLMESGEKGWKPSTVTYNTYMDGLCKKGMAKQALKWLKVMLGEGLDPTAFTLSIILNCLCHNSMVSEAISFLERTTALDWGAGVVAYNTVMSRLCDVGEWRGVLKLLKDMIKKGIDPNTRTFNILIHSLCIGGKSSVAKNLVYNQGFAADVVTYNTLIHWFNYRGKRTEVLDLILAMKVAKIDPDEVTYTIIINGLCREGKFKEAALCFLESVELLGLSKDLLDVLINRLVYSHRIWEIRHIFTEMGRKGFIPDYRVFDYTIRCFCKIGFCHMKEIVELEVILDTMLGSKPSPCGSKKEINDCRQNGGSLLLASHCSDGIRAV